MIDLKLVFCCFALTFKVLPAPAEVTTSRGRSKTCPCESCVFGEFNFTWLAYFIDHQEGRLRVVSMAEPGQYPSPDFGSPPPNSFQHQSHYSGGFHPNMWSWGCTPTEPSWDHGGPTGWHPGAAPWFGSSHRGHGPEKPYGKLTRVTVSTFGTRTFWPAWVTYKYLRSNVFPFKACWTSCFKFAMHHIKLSLFKTALLRVHRSTVWLRPLSWWRTESWQEGEHYIYSYSVTYNI